MTNNQMLIIVAIIVLGTVFTRFIVFAIFPPHKKPPQFITYLGTTLPPAAIGLLVVYALKDTVVLEKPYAIPEIISVLLIVLVHKWWRNSLLSIASGTVVYMVLIQFVF